MNVHLSRGFVILTALLVTSFATGQSLINGSFEFPANPPASGGFLTIAPGGETAAGFTGWTVLSGDVDVVDATAPVFNINWGAQGTIDGEQLLDLNGTLPGAISQDFATLAGHCYEVTFHVANNPLTGGPESAIAAMADVGTSQSLATFPFSHTSSTLTEPHWVTYELMFHAVGPMSRLSFSSTSLGASGGVVLDAISVMENPLIPGDANCDLSVTGADYTIWADRYDDGLGPANKTWFDGDWTGDGHVTGADYTIWADNYGHTEATAVPEPSAILLAAAASCGLIACMRRATYVSRLHRA